MGLSKAISSGGTDWSKYTPISSYLRNYIMNAYGTVQLTNITGKGYLVLATAFLINQSYTVSLKITIDGVVKHYTSSSTQNRLTGIGPHSLINTQNTIGTNLILKEMSQQISGLSEGTLPYPTTDYSNGFVFISQPIFFNQSLLIEIKNPTAYQYNINASFMGGIGS